MSLDVKPQPIQGFSRDDDAPLEIFVFHLETCIGGGIVVLIIVVLFVVVVVVVDDV